MTSVIEDILKQGISQGKIPAKTEEAKTWYRDTAKSFKKISETTLMKDGNKRLRTQLAVGSCYMFYYDAKHKETLPFWDRFPLVFPFSKVDDGFLGINLHYLPHIYRAKLMDALYETTTTKSLTPNTKLDLSYKILSSASKFEYFKPCVKRYLRSQFRSRFLYIQPDEWDIALFLPLERFQGATKQKVWAESKKLIGAK